MGLGQSMSPEERVQEINLYADTMLQSTGWHGFGVDESLTKFSGLNSVGELNYYRDNVLYNSELGTAAATVEKLGSALAGLSMVPNAVGLGALVISMILEVIGKSLDKQSMGTAEMLQRVFAQEKANEVRDLMEEYLKRLRINLGKPQLQLTETHDLETDLSVQLTRLKNSMLKDGHMNSQFLKQWVNGAAFHTQMLIHQARLQGSDGSRAVHAAGIYQQHLNLLLDKYKTYLKDKIYAAATMDREDKIIESCLYYTENHVYPLQVQCFRLKDENCLTGEEIVESMFTKDKITWAKTYFSDLQGNVPALVRQNDSFQV